MNTSNTSENKKKQTKPEEQEMELAQEQTHVEGDLYETPGLSDILLEAAADGIIMLKNDDETLPFRKSDRLAVFGRCQVDTFYVGYGSGGDVNPPHKVSILEGMEDAPELSVDEELAEKYRNWCADHVPYSETWGRWPEHYEEMPLSEEEIAEIAARSDQAVVIIGRAAGEDRENQLTPGSYYLTEEEKNLLSAVNRAFSSMTVLLNIGNIMDFSWTSDYANLKSLLIVWQLGQETGHAVADVLSGSVNPSGHLADTIARSYQDYPSAANFGDTERNVYREGIFTGYRYFETKAKERVLYPFGYGLSYSEFALHPVSFTHGMGMTEIRACMENKSDIPGRDVLMVYYSVTPLNGAETLALEVPAVSLCGFQKSKLLEGGAQESDVFLMNDYALSSYDADGVTGNPSSWVLQAGVYTFYVGDNVRDLIEAGSFTQETTTVTKRCEKAGTLSSEELRSRILGRLPVRMENQTARGDITKTNRGECTGTEKDEMTKKPAETDKQLLHLQDVKDGKATLEEFIVQLSDTELSDLSRGEGPMNSRFGIPGNTGIFGGSTETLRKRGIPPLVTSDGPAGIRLRRYAALLPIGTALASTWDDLLVNKVFRKEAEELEHYHIDVFLAPGMNIHRNPLCGRNFEYYSEDPYLTGWMAAAAVDGIQSGGISACPKHFACNNQETGRNHEDSVVDERTLREIYLRGFEICVSVAKPMNIMTSYNRVNGVYSHYNYDLVTTILRKDWGYQGNVMTDWWMQPGESPEFPGLRNNAYRIRAGVNVLMPGGRNPKDLVPHEDTELPHSMDVREGGRVKDGLTRAELEANAKPVLEFALRRL